MRDAESRLASTGRIVVRPSGTEPVLRITVEARDETIATVTAQKLEEIAIRELAAPGKASQPAGASPGESRRLS